MRVRIKQFLALSSLTALEVVRQPVCLLLATACVVITGLLPLLIMHAMGEPGRLVRDSALALHVVTGLFLGSYAACSSLTRDIRQGTASTVLSKPVGRNLYFLAKFCGLAAVMIVFSLTATLATLLAARAAARAHVLDWPPVLLLLAAPPAAFAIAGADNFFTRKPFMSKAFLLLVLALGSAFLLAGIMGMRGGSPGEATFQWSLIPAGLLIACMILVLTGIAFSLATRLTALATTAVCGIFFLLGLISDYVLGRHAVSSLFARLLYALTPNWQHFWMADALSKEGIPWVYVGWSGLYAVFYLAGVLCWGIVAFQHVELES